MCLVYNVSLITVISSQLKRNHQNNIDEFCKAVTISQCVNEPFFFHLAMLSCDTVQFALIETMIVHLISELRRLKKSLFDQLGDS